MLPAGMGPSCRKDPLRLRLLPLFAFSQIEVPWPLGPPDGRYLVRAENAHPQAEPTHVLLFATLGASRRRRFARRNREALPEPAADAGRHWARDDHRGRRAVRRRGGGRPLAGRRRRGRRSRLTCRCSSARCMPSAWSPPIPTTSRSRATACWWRGSASVRASRWRTDAGARRASCCRRQSRGDAAASSSRSHGLPVCSGDASACLPARSSRCARAATSTPAAAAQAALQLRIAVDAALAELATDGRLASRLAQLDELRPAVGEAATAAPTRALTETELATVSSALSRLEAALRARAASLS